MAQSERRHDGTGATKRRCVLLPLVVIAIGVALCCVGVAMSFASGVLVPPGSAAQFKGNRYISERQVSEYVESYKTQSVGADATDAAWAAFLAEENLTPQTLRDRVIQQLIIDEMVKFTADEQGVKVDEEEFQDYLESFKGNLAFGDEEVYKTTLAQQGQTPEQAEEGFRNLFLQRALFQKVVPVSEPSDEQVKNGIHNAYPQGATTRHLYRFGVSGLDEGDAYDKLENVQQLRGELLSGNKLTASVFERFVTTHSNVDALVASKGDDGWDIVLSDRSEAYRNAVEQTATGEVSAVFADTDGYYFVWVDEEFELPASTDADDVDLNRIPDSLIDQLTADVAQQLWELDCQVYLQQLFSESDTIVFAMPQDVPYNVDMSTAESTQEAGREAQQDADSDE